MAIGGGGFAEGPAAYSGRVTSFVVLSCIVAGSGGILFGYDLGISGGVTSMESFLSKFFPDVYHQMKGDKKVSNYCRFDSELLTVFTSSLYVAGLVATLFASSVTRRLGRRASMLIGGTVFIAGSVFGGAAVNVYMLLLNRILLGIGLGFTNQEVWVRVAQWTDGLVQVPDRCISLEEWWNLEMATVSGKQQQKKASVMIYTAWNIWKERNRRNFEGKLATPLRVLQLIKEEVRLRVAACCRDMNF